MEEEISIFYEHTSRVHDQVGYAAKIQLLLHGKTIKQLQERARIWRRAYHRERMNTQQAVPVEESDEPDGVMEGADEGWIG